MADNKISLGVSYATRRMELANEVLSQAIYASLGFSDSALGKAILEHYGDTDPVESAKKYMQHLKELQH